MQLYFSAVFGVVKRDFYAILFFPSAGTIILQFSSFI